MNLLHRPRAWAMLAAAVAAFASAPAMAAFAYQLVDLGYFSADSGPISIANAINNQRRVVGWADDAHGNAPFRYDYGVSTSIAPLGVPGEFGVANAVDAYSASSVRRSPLSDDGRFSLIAVP